MALKSEIRKAINSDGKYTCVKVWDIELSKGWDEDDKRTMRIEVEVRKRKRTRKSK